MPASIALPPDVVDRNAILRLEPDLIGDSRSFPSTGKVRWFVLVVVDGIVLVSSLLREVESHAERPGDLIGIAVLAGPGRAGVQLTVTWQLSSLLEAPHHYW